MNNFVVPDDTAWYVKRNGKEYGPCTFHKLQLAVSKGYLSPSDLVRDNGSNQWYSASKVNGLFTGRPNRPPDGHVVESTSNKNIERATNCDDKLNTYVTPTPTEEDVLRWLGVSANPTQYRKHLNSTTSSHNGPSAQAINNGNSLITQESTPLSQAQLYFQQSHDVVRSPSIKDNEIKRDEVLGCMFMLFIGIAIYFWGCNSGNDTAAELLARQCVRDELLSPSSADFGWDPPSISRIGTDTIIVRGRVDAKNAFGVVISHTYECRIRRSENGELVCEDVSVY